MSIYQSKQMIRARIAEIDEEMSELNREKTDLETQFLQPEPKDFSDNGIRDMMRRAILSRFGSVHTIKMVIFRPNAQIDMDDDADTYHPSLDLIDRNFMAVPHDIDPNDFCPTNSDRLDENMPESVVLRF